MRMTRVAILGSLTFAGVACLGVPMVIDVGARGARGQAEQPIVGHGFRMRLMGPAVAKPYTRTTFHFVARSTKRLRRVELAVLQPSGVRTGRTVDLRSNRTKRVRVRLRVPSQPYPVPTGPAATAAAEAATPTPTPTTVPSGRETVTVEATKGNKVYFRRSRRIKYGPPPNLPPGVPEGAVEVSMLHPVDFDSKEFAKQFNAMTKECHPTDRLSVAFYKKSRDKDHLGKSSLKVTYVKDPDSSDERIPIITYEQDNKGEKLCGILSASGDEGRVDTGIIEALSASM